MAALLSRGPGRPASPPCPYCGAATAAHASARDINRGVSEVVFHLRRCVACGLIFVANPPDDLGLYYGSERDNVPARRSDLDGVLYDHRHKIDLLRQYRSGGELLEIGPFIGVFCVLAQEAGFQVSAIEGSPECVRYLSEELGVRAIESLDPAEVLTREDRTYDAICLWHSLEHLPRPWEVVELASRRLKPGGVLVIAVPNPASPQARLMGARWPHYDLPRHLYGIPAEWLRAVGDRYGLEWMFMTSRDRGSLQVHASSWGLFVRPFISSSRVRGFVDKVARHWTRLLPPAEGKGAAYTAVLRRRADMSPPQA